MVQPPRPARARVTRAATHYVVLVVLSHCECPCAGRLLQRGSTDALGMNRHNLYATKDYLNSQVKHSGGHSD